VQALLDLRGPQFLVVYALLAALVLTGQRLVRRATEPHAVPRLRAVDPYLVAQLRGGASEAIRVATASLLDRGLLRVVDQRLYAEPEAPTIARRPIERAILGTCTVPSTAGHVLVEGDVKRACAPLQRELVTLALAPSGSMWWMRALGAAVAIGVLETLAVTKISVAFARGRHNVQLLVFAALASGIASVAIAAHRRTPAGDRLVEDLRVLFSGLHARASELPAGGATNELALLAGVFGIAAIPGTLHTTLSELFGPRGNGMAASSSDSGGSSCGSSCGGGGGCGGGCGGCGS
jgi:uncharacterized protein (TIGR04222 family)